MYTRVILLGSTNPSPWEHLFKKSSTLVSFELIIVHDHFIHFVFCQLSLMRAPWCIFLLLYHVWPWLFSGFKTTSYNLMIPRNYAAHDIMFNWGILQNTMAQLFSAEDTVLPPPPLCKHLAVCTVLCANRWHFVSVWVYLEPIYLYLDSCRFPLHTLTVRLPALAASTSRRDAWWTLLKVRPSPSAEVERFEKWMTSDS